MIDDQPIELKLPGAPVWTPKNYDRQLHGPQHLYMALAHSMNLPTVRLGLSLGPAAVLQTMREAGYAGDAKALPSIFLGAVDASPLDRTSVVSGKRVSVRLDLGGRSIIKHQKQ